MRRAGHEARMRKKVNSNKLFAVKPGENSPLGTPTLRWKNIIEVEHGIRVGGCELDSSGSAQFPVMGSC